MSMIRYGVHKELEAAADELLRASLAGVTSMAEKSDILTPWKQQDRLRREVYSSSGVPDPSIRKGMYNRAWNERDEHLNSRDGILRGSRTQSLATFASEHRADISQHLGEAGFDR